MLYLGGKDVEDSRYPQDNAKSCWTRADTRAPSEGRWRCRDDDACLRIDTWSTHAWGAVDAAPSLSAAFSKCR
jgi:hypothetical protein